MKRVLAVVAAGGLLGLVGPIFATGAHASCPPSEWQPNPPAGWHTNSRTISDGQTAQGSPTLTSPADAQFTSYDKGLGVSGGGLPAGVTILSVDSATSVTLSAKATATGSGLSITIAGNGTWQNPSTAQAATPDGSTVVYTQNGFQQTNPNFAGGWYGVQSSAGSSAGISGYAESNGRGDPNHPSGYYVVAGRSPGGSGGVIAGSPPGGSSNPQFPLDLANQC